jgi:hypothetical protein
MSVISWGALLLLSFNLPIIVVLGRMAMVADLREVLQEKGPLGEGDTTSYSRLTGLAGAVMVTALFWAVCNIALYRSLVGEATVGALVRDFWPMFLLGSALFLPYAFNQLKSAFSGFGVGAAQVRAASDAAAVAGLAATADVSLMIVNLTSTIDDASFARAVAAIEKQVNQHFKPAWGTGATLTASRMTLSGATVNVQGVASAMVYVGDASSDPTSGVSGAFGYHTQTHGALPYAFVYLDVCNKAKEPWSCTLSHEVLELLADPNTQISVNGPAPAGADPALGTTVGYGLEVCDPTQGDQYQVDGVVVSNFVTKAYFGLAADETKTNQMELPLAPFGVRPGGYIQYEDLLGTRQVEGPKVSPARIAARKLLSTHRRNARRDAAFPKHNFTTPAPQGAAPTS